MSETVTDSSVSADASALAAPVVVPTESATTAPAVEIPAAASPPTPAPEMPQPSPELPPIETPKPEIPQPAQPPQPVPPTNPTASISSYLSRALEKIQFRKRAKLEKVLTLAAKKRIIKNDDVEKLLKVSDATATNYLSQLVREGKLKRSGVRGGTVYEPI